MINSLKEQIKRLDINKLEQKKQNKNLPDNNIDKNTRVKCVNTSCSFNGLNPNNKAAVGVCAKCGKFEHFSCGGINQEHKDEITSGKNHFFAHFALAIILPFLPQKSLTRLIPLDQD